MVEQAQALRPTSKKDWVEFVAAKRTTRFCPDDKLPVGVSMHNEMGVMVIRVVATGKRDVIQLWGKRVPWDSITEAMAKKLALKAYEKLVKISAVIRM